MIDSIWTRTARLPRFKRLEGDLKTDVLVIGGGITGLLCAWMLKRAGADCAVVEAGRICGGTTGGTTGKITAQHGLIYRRLLREFGPEAARLYRQTQEAALERYRALCRETDCDFEERDSFVYSLDNHQALEEELEALSRTGAPAVLIREPPLPFPVAGAVRFPGQAQFHPLKFLGAVAKGLRIFEHTKVLELGPHTAVSTGGTVRAEKIIIATHFPILNKHGGYWLKLYQQRSYVLALEGAPDVEGMYVDGQEGGLSFRNHRGLLLLGGGSRRTGRPGGWGELEAFARRYYPRRKIAARWATQDCVSLDHVPYIGPYAKHAPGLYVAAGFNKWGMTSSMAAAALLTDMVLGRENEYAQIFRPSRRMLRPQLAVNGLEALLSLLAPTAPRCPHMGCALKYNAAEHSWDCPCHGSRFAEDGALLDNPATDGKKRM